MHAGCGAEVVRKYLLLIISLVSVALPWLVNAAPPPQLKVPQPVSGIHATRSIWSSVSFIPGFV